GRVEPGRVAAEWVGGAVGHRAAGEPHRPGSEREHADQRQLQQHGFEKFAREKQPARVLRPLPDRHAVEQNAASRSASTGRPTRGWAYSLPARARETLDQDRSNIIAFPAKAGTHGPADSRRNYGPRPAPGMRIYGIS